MHEKNGFTKNKWYIIVIMKKILFLDTKLPLNCWAKAINIANNKPKKENYLKKS